LVGGLRGVHNGIKSAIEPHPVRTACLLSAQGLLKDEDLSDPEHFTMDALSHLPQLPVLHDLDAEVSFASVKQAIRLLKSFESPGADESR